MLRHVLVRPRRQRPPPPALLPVQPPLRGLLGGAPGRVGSISMSLPGWMIIFHPEEAKWRGLRNFLLSNRTGRHHQPEESAAVVPHRSAANWEPSTRSFVTMQWRGWCVVGAEGLEPSTPTL